MKIYLFVYYVEDIEKTKKFFTKLGIEFKEAKHGDAPTHYSTKLGDTVFEIYPVDKGCAPTHFRLGLDLSSLGKLSDESLKFIKENSESIQSLGNGQFYSVVTDPVGNKIEVFW